jgi:hypothetical protein
LFPDLNLAGRKKLRDGLSAQATLLLFRDFDGFTDKWKLYFSKNN